MRETKRPIDICDDIVDVFDADRQSDGLWKDAGLPLFLRRHLAMSG